MTWDEWDKSLLWPKVNGNEWEEVGMSGEP